MVNPASAAFSSRADLEARFASLAARRAARRS